eukprot:10606747-Ditylum_brightwellii.AAC.1
MQEIDPLVNNELCTLESGIVPNVHAGGGGLLAEEIAELCQQGIEVDDDNEPAPENAAPPVATMFSVGTWVTPTVCPMNASAATNNHTHG